MGQNFYGFCGGFAYLLYYYYVIARNVNDDTALCTVTVASLIAIVHVNVG